MSARAFSCQRAATIIALIAAVLPLCDLHAQGMLSTQGLGYPPGQMSTGALTMGGATGESDAFSALNPATIALLGSPALLFQAAPEYREMRIQGTTFRTSISRFPLFFGTMPLGSTWSIGASASTLLDRTWETITPDTQTVSGDSVISTLHQVSDGSIVDVRLAVARTLGRWWRVGLGGHAFSGRDVLRNVRTFQDSLLFARDTQQTTLSFGGNAVSVGALGQWPRLGAVGFSYRHGGGLTAYNGDKIVGSGSAPDHYGVSVVYLGISGTTLGVRAARDTWSRLQGISSSLSVHEGWDIGVGGDVTGPRFGGSPVSLRAGLRLRTLPFSADTMPAVKERTVSFGFALPMAGRRIDLSVGALRAIRTANSGTSENAWTVSTGFTIRP